MSGINAQKRRRVDYGELAVHQDEPITSCVTADEGTQTQPRYFRSQCLAEKTNKGEMRFLRYVNNL